MNLYKTLISTLLVVSISGYGQETQRRIMATVRANGQSTVYPGGKWEPGPAKYGSTGLKSITLKTSDGLTLQASVSYPTDSLTGERAQKKFPVIIEFTPYPRLSSPVSPVSYLNGYGYIYLVARPRGTGGSEGEIQQFSSIDGRDGKEIVNWAAYELEGSDGRIGLLGCSYPGATALATSAAVDRNSPVKAAIAANIGLNMQHRQVWTSNGLPNAALSAYVPNATLIMGDLSSVKEYWAKYFDGFMSGGLEAYDGYWKDRLPLEWAQNIADNNIPVLFWSGWKDINETGAVHAYTALQNAVNGRAVYLPMGKKMQVSPKYQIIMGNWGHGQGLEPAIYLQWFETWLKGNNTGIQETQTPMHLYEEGTGNWVNLERYPVTTNYSNWYLNVDSNLTVKAGKSEKLSLSWSAPETQEGKLSFFTPPYESGITLAGPLSVSVYASSNNTNLVLIAKLYDVAPDGKSERITFGALLGSQSELDDAWSWKDNDGTVIWPWPKMDKDIFLKPGEIYRFEVPLAARQWAVLPGHRLRLELTTQSPSDVCPQAGQIALVSEPCRLTKPQQETIPGGVYTIYTGSDHPSALNLPQLPPDTFKAVRSGQLPADWREEAGQAGQGNPFTLPLEW